MLYELALETMVGVLPRFYWLELPEPAEEVQSITAPAQLQPEQPVQQTTPAPHYYYDGEAFRWLWEE
jgi:hypothetical protein